MALNKEGIEQLKSDLRASAARYDQNNFGKTDSACGTTACMAGMCYLRKVGEQEFLRRILDIEDCSRDNVTTPSTLFVGDCIQAGVDQLGLTRTDDARASIFDGVDTWPRDLYRDYKEAESVDDHEAMVEVACSALDRMDKYGSIGGFK